MSAKFRQAILLNFFALPFLFLGSCSAPSVLSLSQREAELRLANGDIQFILDAEQDKMRELSRIDLAAPFFAAILLEKKDNSDSTRAKREALLTEALNSPLVKTAAAKKLISYNAEDFFEKHGAVAANYELDVWADAFKIYSEIKKYANYKKAVPEEKLPLQLSIDMFNFFFDTPFGAAHNWLFSKLDALFNRPPFDSEKVDFGFDIPSWEVLRSFIAARDSVKRYSYKEALSSFRSSLDKGESFLFYYPELANELGRTYQYAASNEGLKKFENWESKKPPLFKIARENPALNLERRKHVDYLLFYYRARISRQLKKNSAAKDLFAQALKIAPDARQKDACIWYILDISYNEKEENLPSLLKTYAPLWTDGEYFADILDKFAAWASKKARWDYINAAFDAIKDHADGDTRAKYAYICGRALEFGLIKNNKAGHEAVSFYKIAYGTYPTAKTARPPYYYRTLASERLKWPLDIDSLLQVEIKPPPQKENINNTDKNTDKAAKEEAAPPSNMDFLNAFFKFGCASLVYPYIRELRDELSIDELRILAEKLNLSGEWQNVINLALYWTKRDGYVFTKRDLEFCYPRGHKDIIERFADTARIERALLFALVRRESVFNANAKSRVGALGLTQLMTGTGTEMARILARNGGVDYFSESGGLNLLDPETNTHLGALYYRQLLDITSSPSDAILAYNGGIGRIRRWRRAARNLSDDLFLETVELTETRNYGRGVLGDETIYRYLYY